MQYSFLILKSDQLTNYLLFPPLSKSSFASFSLLYSKSTLIEHQMKAISNWCYWGLRHQSFPHSLISKGMFASFDKANICGLRFDLELA